MQILYTMDYKKLGLLMCAILWLLKVILAAVTDKDLKYFWNPPESCSCPDDWTVYGPNCYRYIHRNLSWHHARLFCERYGSHLARIEDTATIQFIQADLTGTSSKPQFLWTGLKLANTELQWHDGNKYIKLTLAVEHPIIHLSHDVKICYSINMTSSSLQSGRCDESLPLVCYMEALPTDQLRCLDGDWYPSSWHNDDVIDCKDASDEVFGRSPCSRQYTGDKGILSTQSIPARGGGVPKRYYSYTTCIWVVETPPETLVEITFTEVKLEDTFDTVQIYIGARTEEHSLFLGEINGGVNANISVRTAGARELITLPVTYRSYNNLMIIKFASDGRREFKGFTAHWISVSPASCKETYDVTETKTLLLPPLYNGLYSAWLSCEWKLLADSTGIITVQILELDLPANSDDYLLLLNDNTVSTREVKMTSQTDVTYIGPLIFLASDVTIRFISDTYLQAAGFRLSYYSGCNIELTLPSGVLQSPIYNSESSRLNQNLTCTWIFTSIVAQLSLRVEALDVNHPADSLKIYKDNQQYQSTEELKEGSVLELTSARIRVVLYLSEGNLSGRNMSIQYSSLGEQSPCTQQICKHRGKCVEKGDTFQCNCNSGFEGVHCETNSNECATTPCGRTSRCVDGVNKFFCYCPNLRFGVSCKKVIERKYDLFFYSGEIKPGKATSLHPVNIADNKYLSVMAAVRFSNKAAQGMFFSIYSVTSDYTPAQQILSFDNKGIHINTTSSGLASFPFTKPVNDVFWHKVGFTLTLDTGEILVSVDGIQNDYKIDPDGLNIPKSILTVLGGGFQGYLSQVYILDTKLTGAAYTDYTKASCLADPLPNVQLDWYGYQLDSGVRRITPTHCDDDVIKTATEDSISIYANFDSQRFAYGYCSIPRRANRQYIKASARTEYSVYKSLDVGFNKQKLAECLLARVRRDDVPQYWVRFPTYQYNELTIWRDKEAIPSDIFCPENQLIEFREQSVQVFWKEPVFIGAEVILQNYHPGSNLSSGIHQVSYVARWDDGQLAVCNFKLFVIPTFSTTPITISATEITYTHDNPSAHSDSTQTTPYTSLLMLSASNAKSLMNMSITTSHSTVGGSAPSDVHVPENPSSLLPARAPGQTAGQMVISTLQKSITTKAQPKRNFNSISGDALQSKTTPSMLGHLSDAQNAVLSKTTTSLLATIATVTQSYKDQSLSSTLPMHENLALSESLTDITSEKPGDNERSTDVFENASTSDGLSQTTYIKPEQYTTIPEMEHNITESTKATGYLNDNMSVLSALLKNITGSVDTSTRIPFTEKLDLVSNVQKVSPKGTLYGAYPTTAESIPMSAKLKPANHMTSTTATLLSSSSTKSKLSINYTDQSEGLTDITSEKLGDNEHSTDVFKDASTSNGLSQTTYARPEQYTVIPEMEHNITKFSKTTGYLNDDMSVSSGLLKAITGSVDTSTRIPFTEKLDLVSNVQKVSSEGSSYATTAESIPMSAKLEPTNHITTTTATLLSSSSTKSKLSINYTDQSEKSTTDKIPLRRIAPWAQDKIQSKTESVKGNILTTSSVSTESTIVSGITNWKLISEEAVTSDVINPTPMSFVRTGSTISSHKPGNVKSSTAYSYGDMQDTVSFVSKTQNRKRHFSKDTPTNGYKTTSVPHETLSESNNYKTFEDHTLVPSEMTIAANDVTSSHQSVADVAYSLTTDHFDLPLSTHHVMKDTGTPHISRKPVPSVTTKSKEMSGMDDVKTTTLDSVSNGITVTMEKKRENINTMHVFKTSPDGSYSLSTDETIDSVSKRPEYVSLASQTKITTSYSVELKHPPTEQTIVTDSQKVTSKSSATGIFDYRTTDNGHVISTAKEGNGNYFINATNALSVRKSGVDNFTIAKHTIPSTHLFKYVTTKVPDSAVRTGEIIPSKGAEYMPHSTNAEINMSIANGTNLYDSITAQLSTDNSAGTEGNSATQTETQTISDPQQNNQSSSKSYLSTSPTRPVAKETLTSVMQNQIPWTLQTSGSSTENNTSTSVPHVTDLPESDRSSTSEFKNVNETTNISEERKFTDVRPAFTVPSLSTSSNSLNYLSPSSVSSVSTEATTVRIPLSEPSFILTSKKSSTKPSVTSSSTSAQTSKETSNIGSSSNELLFLRTSERELTPLRYSGTDTTSIKSSLVATNPVLTIASTSFPIADVGVNKLSKTVVPQSSEAAQVKMSTNDVSKYSSSVPDSEALTFEPPKPATSVLSMSTDKTIPALTTPETTKIPTSHTSRKITMHASDKTAPTQSSMLYMVTPSQIISTTTTSIESVKSTSTLTPEPTERAIHISKATVTTAAPTNSMILTTPGKAAPTDSIILKSSVTTAPTDSIIMTSLVSATDNEILTSSVTAAPTEGVIVAQSETATPTARMIFPSTKRITTKLTGKATPTSRVAPTLSTPNEKVLSTLYAAIDPVIGTPTMTTKLTERSRPTSSTTKASILPTSYASTVKVTATSKMTTTLTESIMPLSYLSTERIMPTLSTLKENVIATSYTPTDTIIGASRVTVTSTEKITPTLSTPKGEVLHISQTPTDTVKGTSKVGATPTERIITASYTSTPASYTLNKNVFATSHVSRDTVIGTLKVTAASTENVMPTSTEIVQGTLRMTDTPMEMLTSTSTVTAAPTKKVMPALIVAVTPTVTALPAQRLMPTTNAPSVKTMPTSTTIITAAATLTALPTEQAMSTSTTLPERSTSISTEPGSRIAIPPADRVAPTLTSTEKVTPTSKERVSSISTMVTAASNPLFSATWPTKVPTLPRVTTLLPLLVSTSDMSTLSSVKSSGSAMSSSVPSHGILEAAVLTTKLSAKTRQFTTPELVAIETTKAKTARTSKKDTLSLLNTKPTSTARAFSSLSISGEAPPTSSHVSHPTKPFTTTQTLRTTSLPYTRQTNRHQLGTRQVYNPITTSVMTHSLPLTPEISRSYNTPPTAESTTNRHSENDTADDKDRLTYRLLKPGYSSSSSTTMERYDTNTRRDESAKERLLTSHLDCAFSSCPENSTCIIWESYTLCACKDYFKVEKGQCLHQCDLQYCKNNGECKTNYFTDVPSCKCQDGTLGVTCEEVTAAKVDLGLAVGLPVGLLCSSLIIFCCCWAFCHFRRRKKHRIVQGDDIITMYSYPPVATLTYIPHRYAEHPQENFHGQSTSLISIPNKYASMSDLRHVAAPSKVRLLQGASTRSLVDSSSIIQQKRERLFSPRVDWKLFKSRQSLDRDMMYQKSLKLGSRRSIMSYV